MQFSYWEHKTWFSKVDFTIVGSGIVGLSTAIFLKKKYPKAKVLVLERGVLPQGASTKNAGFACFGSLSEIISDLETHTEQEVFELVKQRVEGIQLLRKLLGDTTIGFAQYGGHEVFLENDHQLFEKCLEKKDEVNQLLRPVFGEDPFKESPNSFGFQQVVANYITHKFEGQLDTGQMMAALLLEATVLGVNILNAVEVLNFSDHDQAVAVQTNKIEFKTDKLFVTTNGFASQFFGDVVLPARAQVLVTKPIENLSIKGTFHFDEGYFYFRNIDDRILFGGGRNLDFETETTREFGQTHKVQEELERLLKQVILPQTPFEIDRRWSGILGVGKQKSPIVKPMSDNVYAGVRLGGMGVAIGTLIGRRLADMV